MWKRLTKLFKHFLLLVVTAGISFMLFITGYIAWGEFQRQMHNDLQDRLSPDTRWVRSKFPIYFLSGKRFGKINIDGSDLKIFYTAISPIQEFIFSPDGNYLVIVTKGEILLYDRKNDQIDLIYSLGSLVKADVARGLIRGVQWFSDGRKFCFESYRWSDIASQDHVYVYNIESKENLLINIPVRPLEAFFWDKKGEYLYGYTKEKKTKTRSEIYRWKFYQLSLAGDPPQFIRTFESRKKNFSVKDFQSRGLDLYISSNASDRRGQTNISWGSKQGRKLWMMRPEKYLYFQDLQGKPKRLFRIVRTPFPLFHLRWIEGEQYVVVTHSSLGILILEPSSGKVGKLISAQAFGWYEKER